MYIGRVPDDQHLSYIINLFKGKGVALSFGNYIGCKNVIKIIEHILNTIYGNKSLSITCSLVSY